jgi:hypothetical protein
MSTDAAAYPVAEPADPGDDTQFTSGLLFDIADALVAHGYPKPQAADWAHLMTAIYQFIYKEKT